jgi:hypothetical protein
MGDMGDYFRDVDAAMRADKELRLEETMEILSHSGLPFENHDCGRHLIFRYGKHVIDFWPTTGRWFDRKTNRRGRWIERLLTYMLAPSASRSTCASDEPQPP